MTGPIPLSGIVHNGVALFGEQSQRSMAKARRDIDLVSAMGTNDLVAVCKSKCWAAEARRLAFALLSAQWEQSADAGRVRPVIDLAEIESWIAHIGLSWHRLIDGWPRDDDDGG